jgi:hypothetical protein
MPHVRRVVPLVLAIVTLTGCFSSHGSTTARTVPDLGACRMLSPDDVSRPSNDTETVSCQQPHTAQTFAVLTLPHQFDQASYDDPEVAAFAYRACGGKFGDFTGADESLAMRTILSWVWFRPSTAAWDSGARWYRCDVIGGGDQVDGVRPRGDGERVGEGAVQRQARLARGDHDRPGRRRHVVPR